MTTTQIKHAGGNHVFGATVSVVTGTPGLTDSAGGFVPSDVGRAVTTASTAGRSILSVTSPTTAVMDGNASATTGPQVLTLAPQLVTVVRKAHGAVDKASPLLPQLPVGRVALAARAINMWINCGGTGSHAARAQKILAAQGLVIQET